MKSNLSIFTIFLCLLFVTAICGLHTLNSNNILPKLDVLLVGTNDIHGTAYPILLSRKDTG